MLVRIVCRTWLRASPIGDDRSRTTSFQFSFRNVFMLSPEQKMVQCQEIVATNIPTLTVTLPSVHLFFFSLSARLISL